MDEDWDYWREQLTEERKKDGTLGKKFKFVKCSEKKSMIFSEDTLHMGLERPEARRHRNKVMEAGMLPQLRRSWSLSKALKRVSTSLCFKRTLPLKMPHFSQCDIHQFRTPTFEYPFLTSDLRHFDSPLKRPVIIKFSPCYLPEDSFVDHPQLCESHLIETRYLNVIPSRIHFKFLRRTRRTPKFNERPMHFEISSIFPIKGTTMVLERPCVHFDRYGIFDESNMLSSWKASSHMPELETVIQNCDLEPFLIDGETPIDSKKATNNTKLLDEIKQFPTLTAPRCIVVSVAALQIPVLLDALLSVSNLIVIERDIQAKIINTSPGHSTLILDHTEENCDVPFDSIAIIGSDRERLLLKALRHWPTCKMLFFESCLDFATWITLQVDSNAGDIPEEPTAVSPLIDISSFVA